MELKSLDSTKKVAEAVAINLKPNDFLLLSGNLGAGKTTFTRFLIHYLQQKYQRPLEEIVSPTFNIVQYYDGTNYVLNGANLNVTAINGLPYGSTATT
ncbi:MAG: hypothetical protein RLZ08_278, partial [Pseudomonadota bacterium]